MLQLNDRITIHQSAFWYTNTGVVNGPAGTLLIDPGVLPAELEDIGRHAAPIHAGFCTHAHWDHVLWQESFGTETPRFAYIETVSEMRMNRERILRNITDPSRWEIEGSWNLDLLLQEQSLVAGPATIGGLACCIIPLPGHNDGMAGLELVDDRITFVADTLSDKETPAFYDGRASVDTYLQTLDVLQGVIDRSDWIVPGHGTPAKPAEAQRRLDLDRAYLQRIVPFVAARAGEGAEEIARALLIDLDEQRATEPLAWSMHLHNVEQLLNEVGA